MPCSAFTALLFSKYDFLREYCNVSGYPQIHQISLFCTMFYIMPLKNKSKQTKSKHMGYRLNTCQKQQSGLKGHGHEKKHVYQVVVSQL